MNSPSLMCFPINQRSLPEILQNLPLDQIQQNTSGKQPGQRVMVCGNPHSFAQTIGDQLYSDAMQDADFLIADGVGVTLVEKLLGRVPSPRITGNDFFNGVNQHAHDLSAARQKPLRVFFFGSSEHVLALIKEKFEKEFSNLELCGLLSPPFGDWSDEQNNKMVKTINEALPDILWVGMTAPKQEKWVYQNRRNLNARVIGNIGAVFDFYAETYPRAPQWACSLGLEWVIRLLKEPKRLWRRTFVSAPIFLYYALTNK